jgi:hypothetical protein
MSNALSVYDPLFYASEAIIQLRKALGMAARVHRGYDKNPQQKGSVISISRPSTFSAQDAPSVAQDILAGEVQIALNYWREVKFKLTDKELTFTTEKIITDHIGPAAYALADDIDTKLCLLYRDIPWSVATTAPLAVADITGVRKVLFTNGAPNENRHLMLSGTLEQEALNQAAFSQFQGAGQAGAETQMRGTLGPKFGLETFANQNVQTHVAGVSADATGALVGAHAKGLGTVAFDGVTAAGTFKKGDSFVIAGNTQRYTFTADALASGGAVTATAITPALVQDYIATAVITITLTSGEQSLAFHRNAFALAMAPLSEVGGKLGAQIATINDPVSNLSLRSRLFYDGDASTVFVAIDVLYGIKTLDPNLGCRLVD